MFFKQPDLMLAETGLWDVHSKYKEALPWIGMQHGWFYLPLFYGLLDVKSKVSVGVDRIYSMPIQHGFIAQRNDKILMVKK